jgi:hypothetical protein
MMYAAKVVTFLNAKVSNLKFKMNDQMNKGTYIDVDIDVTITHPFPGQTQYNGYDVRGILIGNGSVLLNWPDIDGGSDLHGTVFSRATDSPDQIMWDYQGSDPLKDPYDGPVGMPDGFTRWWNPAEFTTPDFLGYTPGKFGNPGYLGTATLNPYKYYADHLNPQDYVTTYLQSWSDDHGVFSAGASNTRNYYLRFPIGAGKAGVKFTYAVLANWEGTEPQFHPANAPEAVACLTHVTPNVWYADSTANGGNLILDVSVFDWDSHTVSGVTDDYRLIVESTVLSAPHPFSDPEMTPASGGDNYQTYHIEIPADNVTSTNGNEYWVIAECKGKDYTNVFGVTNLANTDNLTAFFLYDLAVGTEPPPNTPPVVNGITDDIPPAGLNTTVTAVNTSVTYTALFNDPDTGQTHTFSWYIEDSTAADPTDPPDSMPYDWSLMTPGQYKIWVKVSDGVDETTGGPYAVTLNTPPAITGITDNVPPTGLNTIVNALNTAVTYSALFNDPDPGQTHTFKWYIEDSSATGPSDPPDSMPYNWAPIVPGDYQIWVKVNDGFDEVTGGPYVVTRAAPGWGWTKTWGGTGRDNAFSVAVDGAGNMYVAGGFYGTVDFDPGLGVDSHDSNGDFDAFLSKFDSSGAFLWAQTWGGPGPDNAFTITLDGSGNIYLVGCFSDTVDFDPGVGVDAHISNGDYDAYLSKFDSSGAFLWGESWGGTAGDNAFAIAEDGSGNVYVAGCFSLTVDFDPGLNVDSRVSNGNYDAFLSKFDSTGAFLWVQTWGGTGLDNPFGIHMYGSGSIYVTGCYSGIVDFDSGPDTENHISNGAYDAFLSKFNFSGSFQWAETWGGTGEDNGFAVTVDGSENIYVAGCFSDTVDFDPAPGVVSRTSSGDYDAYLSRFNFFGALLWVDTWGGTGEETAIAAALDGSGNISVAGHFFDTVDFDPGAGVDNRTSNGLEDSFLSRFNSSGTFLLAKTWGGIGKDGVFALTPDTSGNYYVTGWFADDVDFDPGAGTDDHTSNGAEDAYLGKFGPE